jgi:hypothetical protein
MTTKKYRHNPATYAAEDDWPPEVVAKLIEDARRMAHGFAARMCHKSIADELESIAVAAVARELQRADKTRGTWQAYIMWRVRGELINGIHKWDWAPRRVAYDEAELTSGEMEMAAKIGRWPSRMEVATDWLGWTDGAGIASQTVGARVQNASFARQYPGSIEYDMRSHSGKPFKALAVEHTYQPSAEDHVIAADAINTRLGGGIKPPTITAAAQRDIGHHQLTVADVLNTFHRPAHATTSSTGHQMRASENLTLIIDPAGAICKVQPRKVALRPRVQLVAARATQPALPGMEHATDQREAA